VSSAIERSRKSAGVHTDSKREKRRLLPLSRLFLLLLKIGVSHTAGLRFVPTGEAGKVNYIYFDL